MKAQAGGKRQPLLLVGVSSQPLPLDGSGTSTAVEVAGAFSLLPVHCLPAGNEESPGCRTAFVLVHVVRGTPFAASCSDAEKISEQKLPSGTARDLVRDLAPFQEWWVVQGTPFSQGPQDSLW